MTRNVRTISRPDIHFGGERRRVMQRSFFTAVVAALAVLVAVQAWA
jgi:hypothetical protein